MNLVRLVTLICIASLAVAASTPAATTSTASCHDPIVHDSYDGFHVGVPAGWNLSSIGGAIVVAPDYGATTEAVVQTAFAGSGQSPQAFLSRMLTVFARSAKQAGNVLTFHLTSSTTGSVSGRVGSTALTGSATVSFLPIHSAHGSRLGVVSAYWAPTGQLAGLRAKLASVGACFGTERGTLARFYRDQAFGYTLPLGWTVAHETSDALYLDDGANASANFILAGPFLASSTGVTDAQSLLTYSFGKLGINVGSVLATTHLPTTSTATGGKQEELITQFIGTVGGKTVHGLVRVTSTTTGGVTVGALRIALATPALWNPLNGALIWIAYGIQHNFTQDLQAIQHAQQQMAGFAQQVAGFDHALNGTDLLRDPTTGYQYEAPYSAYSQDGPQGAGYYLGSPGSPSEHKLTIITPN